MTIYNFKKKRLLTFTSAFVILVFVSSCLKDHFELEKLAKTEWNPNLAAALVHSSLTVQDILTNQDKSGVIKVDSTNFCTLVYQGNLFSIIASDLVQMPDQSIPSYTASLDLSQIPVLVSNATITVPYTQTVSFTPGTNNPKIDSVLFKTGIIDLKLNSDFKYNARVKIDIPAAKKSGKIFSTTIVVNYSGTVPVVANTTIDLTGYQFDMTNGGTTSNQFAVNYEVTIYGNSSTPPTTSNRIMLSGDFKNLRFDRMFGDLGQLPLSLDTDTVDISVFKNAIGSGLISFVDPRLKMIISNSYGIPIEANISQLDAYTPGAIPFQITGYPSPLPLLSPNKNQIGQTLTGSFTLNNLNSNLFAIIKKAPQYFIYKLDSKSNPAGATHDNFILDTSRFKVDMEIELPLWGTAKDFILIDTIEFKLEENLTSDIETLTVRTFNSNGFPIDVAMQVYFTDSTYKTLDSLVTPYQLILKSGIVNPSTSKVVAPTEKIYDVVLTQERIRKLKTAKFLLIKANASTASGGNTNVRIYSNYKIDFKLGVQAQVRKKI